jgi:mlo protein
MFGSILSLLIENCMFCIVALHKNMALVATQNFNMFPSFFYAKMGSFFKKEIFDEHVQQGLVGWAQKAKKRKGLKESNGAMAGAGSTNGSSQPIFHSTNGEASRR